eukprot:gnl/TRDRNA2_/TRDRNA2_144615_c0_seq1.p1 gnl/TRDRNA2_/TRDRNA2_144615_c0~~gnl/TRDRNA2_/TRDRNA2_144615_c0_seq1.p1  ORF type:complete len:261 (+),score=35.42 gnl/TRDRNA2_/TRDRNA2_144615_c0_seq1:2-784(+)
MSDKNEEFDLKYINVSTALIKNEGGLGSDQQEFAEVVYAVHLERFSHYYMCVIILPLTLVILFSLGVFFIDPERGERLGVSMTLLLTVMAVSFFTADSIPKSGGGDTWLQLFQTWCYVLVMIPLFISLALELLRRIYLQRRKAKQKAAGRPSEDEPAVDWLDWRIDHILRLPYALCVLAFMLWVSWKYIVSYNDGQLSIVILLTFLCILTLGLFGLTVAEMVVCYMGGNDWSSFSAMKGMFQDRGEEDQARSVSSDAASK